MISTVLLDEVAPFIDQVRDILASMPEAEAPSANDSGETEQ